MRSRTFRTAVAAIGGLLCTVALPSAASATNLDYSIDTNVPGGSAWVVSNPGYLGGYLYDGNYSVNAYIGVIDLKGTLVNQPGTPMGDLQVFCIDVMHDLQGGTFTEVPVSNLETAGLSTVLYTSTQVQNLFKFLAYANGKVVDAETSAAAQLGVWEIISEPNTSWDLTGGNFHVSMWDNQPDAVSLAQQWLTASANQSTANYTLHVLDPGTTNNQVQAFVTHNLPGDNSTPGVPEPATWGMIVVGFGLLGGALRRRKQDDALLV